MSPALRVPVTGTRIKVPMLKFDTHTAPLWNRSPLFLRQPRPSPQPVLQRAELIRHVAPLDHRVRSPDSLP
ncbi:hypothetical protein GCM10010193_23380 [Kitasatospora atroaurantiaca]